MYIRYLKTMQSKSATSLLNLVQSAALYSSPVVTSGKAPSEHCNPCACLNFSGSVGGGDCKTNDGTNKKIFQPAFPASYVGSDDLRRTWLTWHLSRRCPFVTAVGGTTRVNPEVAVSFSGGGFSRYFSRPSYQSTAVANYITKIGSTNSGLYKCVKFNNFLMTFPDSIFWDRKVPLAELTQTLRLREVDSRLLWAAV
jgi:hypothetical protein